MPYISIKDALQITGVSEPTLRRLARKAKGEQKQYIEGKLHLLDSYLYKYYPTISGSTQSLVTSQNDRVSSQNTYTYDYLTNQNGNVTSQKEKILDHPDQVTSQTNQPAKNQEPPLPKEYYQNLSAAKDYTIQTISQQLQIKDAQLQERDQQINQLIERDRESNIIIQSLQERVPKQLQAPQQAQEAKQVKIPMIDKVLTGVAIVSAVALLIFILLMVFAYFGS